MCKGVGAVMTTVDGLGTVALAATQQATKVVDKEGPGGPVASQGRH